MVAEIPDDLHPRARCYGSMVLLATGMLCFVLATAVFFGKLTGPTWAFICLAALGALPLFSRRLDGCFRVATVLFFVER